MAVGKSQKSDRIYTIFAMVAVTALNLGVFLLSQRGKVRSCRWTISVTYSNIESYKNLRNVVNKRSI